MAAFKLNCMTCCENALCAKYSFYKQDSFGSPPHTDPTKKTKSLRHKHKADTQCLLLFRFLLVFYLPLLVRIL